MKLADVLARFGSREELARWTGATMRAVYQWETNDEGDLVSRAVRCRIVMGLVLKTAHDAQEAGLPIDAADLALLAEDLEAVGSETETETETQ